MVRSTYSSAVDYSQQHRDRDKIMGTLGIEPGAVGLEARTLPLCYAAPNWSISLVRLGHLTLA